MSIQEVFWGIKLIRKHSWNDLTSIWNKKFFHQKNFFQHDFHISEKHPKTPSNPYSWVFPSLLGCKCWLKKCFEASSWCENILRMILHRFGTKNFFIKIFFSNMIFTPLWSIQCYRESSSFSLFGVLTVLWGPLEQQESFFNILFYSRRVQHAKVDLEVQGFVKWKLGYEPEWNGAQTEEKYSFSSALAVKKNTTFKTVHEKRCFGIVTIFFFTPPLFWPFWLTFNKS